MTNLWNSPTLVDRSVKTGNPGTQVHQESGKLYVKDTIIALSNPYMSLEGRGQQMTSTLIQKDILGVLSMKQSSTKLLHRWQHFRHDYLLLQSLMKLKFAIIYSVKFNLSILGAWRCRWSRKGRSWTKPNNWQCWRSPGLWSYWNLPIVCYW